MSRAVCGSPEALAASLTAAERRRLEAMKPLSYARLTQPQSAEVIRKRVATMRSARPTPDILANPGAARAWAVAEEVALEHGTTVDELRSPLRTAARCAIRAEYYRRARAQGLTLVAIGLAIGRHHGSVLHGLARKGGA